MEILAFPVGIIIGVYAGLWFWRWHRTHIDGMYKRK